MATQQPGVERTEMGLVIAGTRITLYGIYDYLIVQDHRFTTQEILELYPSITREQLQAALDYIDQHKVEFEEEYRTVLEQAEANRRYWDERNKDRLAQIEAMRQTPEWQARWAEFEQRRQELLQERVRGEGAPQR